MSQQQEFHWELAAESITVRIRWFGLIAGYLLVNVIGPHANRPALNAILALGAVYALLDTWWSMRRRVFLNNWPLTISLMEAVFIGLLCHFEQGLASPFRFYYLLSIVTCAVRNPPATAWTTCGLHMASATTLAMMSGVSTRDELTALLVLLGLMVWLTWASTALVGLVKDASQRLSSLNGRLQEEQTLLEQRIAERTRALQESQALLVQREKQAAFGLLAAGIAHEVGNPLAAISQLVQMLNLRPTDEYTRERLHMVDSQLRRIQRTLRELVDFSRPVTRELSLCDIHVVINDALNIAKYYKRRKGKHIVTEFAADLPRLRIIRDQLVQVFLNLILNAMDATQEGGTLTISTAMREGRLEITVEDDGHGIPPEASQRIFEPYYTTKETGTGLGLFVCRNVLEQSGAGEIILTHSSDSGTAFTVSLHCEEGSGSRLTPPPSVSPTTEPLTTRQQANGQQEAGTL